MMMIIIKIMMTITITITIQYSAIIESSKLLLLLESISVFCSKASTATVVDVKHCKSSGCEELLVKIQGR